MELIELIERLASGVEVAAAAVIGMAAIEATLRAAPLFFNRKSPADEKVEVRLGLGRWLALGLDFAVAADILRTAIAPTWHDIGQLASIAALRTALNYFLEREIERAATRIGSADR